MSMSISEMRQFAAANTGSLTITNEGRLVKATLGERFRMFFNIHGARDENNRRILNALKSAMLDNLEFFGYDEAAVRELDALPNRFALRGKDLSALFTRIDVLKSQTQGIEDLTASGLGVRFSDHPACQAFENRGRLPELKRVAVRYIELAYGEAVREGQKKSFSVGTALSAFMCECQAMFDDAEKGSPVLTDLLVANFGKLMVRGDATLRRAEDVIANLTACRTFVNDAKAIAEAEGKPYIADIALSYVNRLGGATKIGAEEIAALQEYYHDGTLTGKYDLNAKVLKQSVIDAAEQVRTSVKTELKMALVENDSTAMADRLTHALTRKFLSVPVFAGTLFKGGADCEQCMCYHQARAYAAQLTDEERQRLKTFFASPKAENLLNFYMQSAFSANQSKDIDEMLAQPMMQHVFAGLRDGILGRVVPPAVSDRRDPVDYAQLPASVTCRRIGLNTLISKQGFVPAMGLYSDTVSSTRFLGRTMRTGAGFVSCYLAKGMAGGEEAVLTQFKRIVRGHGLTVRLSDGTLLPDDPDKACDALARLVKGDPEAAFGDLDRQERRRALLMMTLLTQELVDIAHRSVATVMDPERKNPALISGDGTKSESRQNQIPPTVVLALDDKGGVSLHMDSRMPIVQYTVEKSLSWNSKKETYDVSGDSNVRTSIDVTIDAEEMARLAELDWTQCDVREANRELASAEHEKDWAEKLPEKLPETFRVRMSVVPTYSLYIAHQARQEYVDYPSTWEPGD